VLLVKEPLIDVRNGSERKGVPGVGKLPQLSPAIEEVEFDIVAALTANSLVGVHEDRGHTCGTCPRRRLVEPHAWW
jgi:hypothetical protein